MDTDVAFAFPVRISEPDIAELLSIANLSGSGTGSGGNMLSGGSGGSMFANNTGIGTGLGLGTSTGTGIGTGTGTGIGLYDGIIGLGGLDINGLDIGAFGGSGVSSTRKFTSASVLKPRSALGSSLAGSSRSRSMSRSSRRSVDRSKSSRSRSSLTTASASGIGTIDFDFGNGIGGGIGGMSMDIGGLGTPGFEPSPYDM